MKTHTTIGYDILGKANCELMTMAAEIALYHHEKWDGSGYPEGLAGEDIPQSAQVVAVADVFDALSVSRPYKNAWPVDDCIDFIKGQSNKHFNPAVVEAFLSCLPEILATLDYYASEEIETTQ